MVQRTTAPVPAPVTPAHAPTPPLLVELRRLLAAHRPAVRQGRVFDRLRALVLGLCWPLSTSETEHACL